VTQERFLPIVIDLEQKRLVDEQTGSLLKTLILEENVEVFRVINSYMARALNEHELAHKLTNLADQLGSYIERP